MRALLISAKQDFSYWSAPESAKFSGTKTLNPPLGLITVAALLPPEWELRLVDLNTRELSEADWNWADMVMISAMMSQRKSLLETVRQAKEKKKPVVVGGPYPTALPQELLDAGVDFVVRGEGENTVPLLLDASKAGRKSGLFEADDKPGMSTSPLPRYDLVNLADYQVLIIQTSRGCPFECEFCDIVSLFGRKPRYKTPDQVLSELELLYSLGWRGTVFIGDDNFIGSKKHARAILERMTPWHKSLGEPFGFVGQVSANLGQDLEMIDLMTAANFGTVFVGMESSDEEVLEFTRKYQNVRNPLAESVSVIIKNGLQVTGSFIIGFDGEKEGIADRICALVEETSVPIAFTHVLFAPPGTRLWQRLQREGRLLDTNPEGEVMAGDRMNFVPTRPKAEIFAEYIRVWDCVYRPDNFFNRTARCFLKMRPTRAAMGMDDGNTVPQAKPPLKQRLKLLRGFCRLIWVQGIRPAYRRCFWMNLLQVLRKNPSRIGPYLHACGFGENFFRVRERLLEYQASGRLEEAS